MSHSFKVRSVTLEMRLNEEITGKPSEGWWLDKDFTSLVLTCFVTRLEKYIKVEIIRADSYDDVLICNKSAVAQ